MKNSHGSSLSKVAITTGSLLVALSGNAWAEEWVKNTSPLLTSTEWLTTQIQSNIATTLSSAGDYKGVRYDTLTNTLVIWASNNTQKGEEKASEENLKKKVEFYEQRDIETFFLFDLDIFNALYQGDLSVLATFPEIATLLEKQDILIQKKESASSEEESKIIDKKLLVMSQDITKMKEHLSITYMEDVTKKIKELLPTYAQKVAYIGKINPENEKLIKFTAFFQTTLAEGGVTSMETPSYKDTAYLPETSLGGLVSTTSQVNETVYSKEQKEYYKNRSVSLKDAWNIDILSKLIDTSNVLNYLADTNNDGKVSDKDRGILSGQQLSILLSETEARMTVEEKGEDFYNNLSYIFQYGWVKTTLRNRADLVAFLQANPLAKIQFSDAFYRLNISGADVGYVLRYGSEWLKKWEQTKGHIFGNSLVGKLFTKIQDGTKNLGTELIKLKNTGVISDQEYLHMINTLQKTVNSPAFEDQVMAQSMNLLSMISASYFSANHGGIQANYSNQALDMRVSQAQKKFIDSIKLSTGIYNANGGNMVMIGVEYAGTKQISETTAVSWGVGINLGLGSQNNVLPVLSLGYISNTNTEELKNAGIVDFNQTEKSFKIGGSLSLINTQSTIFGLGFRFSEDKKVAIEKKTAEYSKLLDTVFACDVSLPLEVCMQHIREMISAKEYGKVTFLWDSLRDTETRLSIQGFDSMNASGKQRIIEEEKMFYIAKFLNTQASTEEEKGWNISGWGIGISIVTKMIGIPFIPGIETSKISMKYTPHQAKKTMAEIMRLEGIGETTILNKNNADLGEKLEKMLGIEGLKVSYEGGYLKITSVSGDIMKFLSQNGVDVRMGISGKTLSHIAYSGNTLTIGDIGKISYFNTLTAEGKKATLIIGDKGTKGTEPFAAPLSEVLKKHTPEPLSENILFTHATLTEQQVAALYMKKFSLGIF